MIIVLRVFVAADRGLIDHFVVDGHDDVADQVLRHEQLVEDFEAKVRRILEFVGLDFEMACLESYKTERSVRTASSEQVRRPF